MPISLRFNGEQFYSDLRDRLVVAMDEVNSEFFRVATSGMSQEAKLASEKDKAVVESDTDYKGDLGHSGADQEYINARCHFYASAILESFGMGSKADTTTEPGRRAWEEYKKSPLFNDLRRGKNIVGRKKGPYINIFGEQDESSGKNAGKNLEGLWIHDKRMGYDVKLDPDTMHPKYMIQNAETWLMQDRETSMERRIRLEVQKFIMEMNDNPLKYFYYVEV